MDIVVLEGTAFETMDTPFKSSDLLQMIFINEPFCENERLYILIIYSINNNRGCLNVYNLIYYTKLQSKIKLIIVNNHLERTGIS